MALRATEVSKSGYAVQITSGFGGCCVEWYRDNDNNSGYGDNPEVAYWYGASYEACRSRALEDPDPKWWAPLTSEDGPDRTDPGYWQDNF